MQGEVAIELRIFYSSERPDLDESLILDCLQDQFLVVGGKRLLSQRGVYRNDRQVREKHVYHSIDKRNPRTEILITEREAN
jgi:Holliday junction resolvase RusA-like endonuclease